MKHVRCFLKSASALVLLLCNVVESQWLFDDGVCLTPDRSEGKCINIYSCQPMIDFLAAANGNLNPETREALRSYLCSRDANGPKVCCPSKPIVISAIGTGVPIDPANHPNVNLLPLNECGVTPNIDRIINGNKTQLYEFPWMAALKYTTSTGPDFRCGATLINKRYILTAAHCIKTKNLPLIGVRLGEYDLNNATDCETHPLGSTICAPPVQDFDITVADAIVHPNYNETPNANDIALIRLPRDANITVDSVNPVCMPIQLNARNNKLTKKLTVTGWGATETGYSSPDLLKVTIPVIPNTQCSDYYKNVITITEKQLCAGGRNAQDSCAGDSGGPLMDQLNFEGILRTVQYGVVSFGPRLCGRENFPGVYTRITAYIDWILDNMKP